MGNMKRALNAWGDLVWKSLGTLIIEWAILFLLVVSMTAVF